MRFLHPGYRWLLAGVVLALVLPARAAEVDKYLPADAEFVSVVNVKQAASSAIFKKYGEEKLRALLKDNEQVAKIMEDLGFDPFKDVTSFVGAGSSLEPDGKAYLIAHGNFDVKKIDDKAEEEAKNHGDILKIHKEGAHKIYEVNSPGDDKPLFVGLVDKGTMVGSNEKDFVLGAFEVASGKKTNTVKKELKDLIEKSDPKQTWWFVMTGTVLGKSPLAAVAQQDEKAKKIIEKIDSLALGITVDKDIKLSFAIGSKSAENAKELAEDLKTKLDEAKGMVALIAGQNKQLEPLVDVVNSIKVGTDGSSVTFKGEVGEELIEKALKKD
jgi:hypothetical protein